MSDKNRLIILDLDSTVISSREFNKKQYTDKLNLKFSIYEENYYIYHRPYLQEFLDYIFSTFKVAVWTAASTCYADFIVKNIILTKSNRHLEFVHTNTLQSTSMAYSSKKSPKDLDMVFKEHNYSRKDVVILDDNYKVCNQYGTFLIHPFEIKDYHTSIEQNKEIEDDHTLLYIIDVLKSLEPHHEIAEYLSRNIGKKTYSYTTLNENYNTGLGLIYNKIKNGEDEDITDIVYEYSIPTKILDSFDFDENKNLLTLAASKTNTTNILSSLISCNADVNKVDFDGNIPLFYAIATNKVKNAIMLNNSASNHKLLDARKLFPELSNIETLLKIKYPVSSTNLLEYWLTEIADNIEDGKVGIYDASDINLILKKYPEVFKVQYNNLRKEHKNILKIPLYNTNYR